jgi:hypothetical protein
MQRRRFVLVAMVGLVAVLGLATPAAATTAVPVTASITEPIVPAFKQGDCPVLPGGFCGHGLVHPFGLAQDTIDFGAGCAGACDLRTLVLPQGTLYFDEFFNDLTCPGSCHPNRAAPISASITDVVSGGTGVFAGATGTLTGSVKAAGPESLVQLSGTITLAN